MPSFALFMVNISKHVGASAALFRTAAFMGQEYSTEPFCKITVLQGHHELAGNLSTGIEILLAICCYRKLAGSAFTKLLYGWKN